LPRLHHLKSLRLQRRAHLRGKLAWPVGGKLVARFGEPRAGGVKWDGLLVATERGARTLGVEDEYGIEEGKPADLVIFDATSPIDVISLRATRRYVLRRGRVIAETTPARTALLGEPLNLGVVGRG